MDKLRTVREQAEEQYIAEAQLLQTMTAVESLNIWAKLQQAFEWQLEQTAYLFETSHHKSLIDLQARLNKLIE